MKKPTQLTFEEVFDVNPSYGKRIVKALGVTNVVELACHSPRMVRDARGLGLKASPYVIECLARKAQRLRGDYEKLNDYAKDVYGELNLAPVILLNFREDAKGLVRFAPDPVVNFLGRSQSCDIAMVLSYGSEPLNDVLQSQFGDKAPRMMINFRTRLRERGLIK